MVFGVSPVTLMVKLLVPVPEDKCELAMVGLCEVLQHTPRAVTLAPPSEVTLPPQVALVEVMLVTLSVAIVGKEGCMTDPLTSLTLKDEIMAPGWSPREVSFRHRNTSFATPFALGFSTFRLM